MFQQTYLLIIFLLIKYTFCDNTYIQEVFAIIDDILNDTNLQSNTIGGLKAIKQLLTNSILDSNWNNYSNNSHEYGSIYSNNSNKDINDFSNASPTKNFKMNFVDIENLGSDSAEEPSPFMTDRVSKVKLFRFFNKN